VKVCDLGLATTLPANGRGIKEICGTAPYMAPEMLRKERYRCGVDLWSCGATAYLMLLGGFPYSNPKNNSNQMKAAIIEGKVKPSFKALTGFAQPSDAAVVFLKMLLNRNPELRAGCTRALSSEFISSCSRKPTFSSLPSFGPTLSIAYDTTKDQPAAETPQMKDLPLDKEEDTRSDDSTACGSGKEFETVDTCGTVTSFIPESSMAFGTYV